MAELPLRRELVREARERALAATPAAGAAATISRAGGDAQPWAASVDLERDPRLRHAVGSNGRAAHPCTRSSSNVERLPAPRLVARDALRPRARAPPGGASHIRRAPVLRPVVVEPETTLPNPSIHDAQRERSYQSCSASTARPAVDDRRLDGTRSHRRKGTSRDACASPSTRSRPSIPGGFRVIAGGAAGEPLTLTSADGTEFSRLPRARRGTRPASSCCPTCAACSASTSSWPSASPPPATRRSRSTTSAAPPGSARATRTSSTCRTSSRRTPETVAQDVARRARAPARRDRREHDRHRRLLLRRRPVVHAGRRAATPGWPASSASTARSCARASAGRSTARRRPRSRCSACSPATTRTSRPTRSRRSTRALPVEHEIHIYQGAPHSFFDRRQEQYASESEDAWERILGFISQRQAEG